MLQMDIPPSVKAIGRAGAGTNNVPVKDMNLRGVPVFNAPGANANAVKELVLAGLLIASRNLIPAIRFTENLKGTTLRCTSWRKTARSSLPESNCRGERWE